MAGDLIVSLMVHFQVVRVKIIYLSGYFGSLKISTVFGRVFVRNLNCLML